MISCYAHDGESISCQELVDLGFSSQLIEGRDYYSSPLAMQDDSQGEYAPVLSFVGFVTNDNNDTYVVFPKHYRVDDPERDASSIFKAISTHIQKNPHLYIGPERKGKYETNFPFASFFAIYDHYLKHGLYFENEQIIKEGSKGKLHWKSIVKKSQKNVVNDILVFSPLYYKESHRFDTFLTECMIFAIEYSIEKFGFLLGLHELYGQSIKTDLLNDTRFVLDYLQGEREHSFSDIKKRLIENLIDFFSQINNGGSYYLKHYSFNLIWEDLVLTYLQDHFDGINPENGALLLSEKKAEKTPFKKTPFKVNAAKPNQKMELDYYFVDLDMQYIIDAKYYTELSELNYKQLVYSLILQDKHDISDSVATYSALILPSETRETQEHFRLNADFNNKLSAPVIYEEYFDIHQIVDYWVTR